MDLSTYAGRWVAFANGRVAGVGHTAAEALHLARRNRPKERLTVAFVEGEGKRPLTLPALMDRIRPLLNRHETAVYLVGGAVRDALLGRSSNDLDFVVPERAIKLTFRVADRLHEPAYVLDRERDAGRVVMQADETTLDFTRFRQKDLDADLHDRDFTINAIALPATAKDETSLIDPCGGVADLRAGLIRQASPTALTNDAVRGLRGLRLALTLGFEIEGETAVSIAQSSQEMHKVSIERVQAEFVKLLHTDFPDQAAQLMDESGWLHAITPEITDLRDLTQSPPHHENVLAHTISVLRWLRLVETAVLTQNTLPEPTPIAHAIRGALSPFAEPLCDHFSREINGGLDGLALLRLAALFHDVGKKATRTVEENGRIRYIAHDRVGAKIAAKRLRRLTFSNEAIAHVKRVVDGHMRPLYLVNNGGTVSRRSVFRYFRATGEAGLDIGLLALADHLATYDGVGDAGTWRKLTALVAHLFRHYFEHHEETVAPPQLINGRELITALSLTPGPEVGRLLRLITEAQAAGEIQTKGEAIALARQENR